MHSAIRPFTFILLLLVMSANLIYGQQVSWEEKTDTSFNLIGDTLFSNHDLKMFVGQKLIVGKGSEENGVYNTIGFKSAFAWPEWLWKESETKNNYQYQEDPQKRTNDKVREYLSAGDTVVIKKIKRDGNKHAGYRYTAFLKGKKFLAVGLRSNVIEAIKKKELFIIPQ